jgi:hypothetical protein
MNHATRMISTCVAVAALAAVVAETASATSAEEKCGPPAGLARESTAPNLLKLPVDFFKECTGTSYGNIAARRSALRHAKAKKRHAQKMYFNPLARAPIYRPMIVLGVAW